MSQPSPEQQAAMTALSENIGILLARQLQNLGYVLVNEQMLADALRAAFGNRNADLEAAMLMAQLRRR